MLIDQELKLPLLERIENQLKDITKFTDVKQEVGKGEIVIGEASDREKRLYALEKKYKQQSKQAYAAAYVLDPEESLKDIMELETCRFYFDSLIEVLDSILWAEIRSRLHAEICAVTIRHDAVGIRKGSKIVVLKTPDMPQQMVEIFKGPMP